MSREITFASAILEATGQIMEKYPEVYLIGQGVDDFKGVWGTTEGLVEKFGQARVVDTPLSENAMTGIALGTSLAGMRPIFVHLRIDFMLMCMDALFNHAAKWYYMTGLQKKTPIVVRAVIGKGWGQSIQHAQSFYSIFAHFPGIKIVAPVTPADAKGLLTAAVQEDGPIIIIEARWLYNLKGDVPVELYAVPIGKARIVRQGSDITLVSVSGGVIESLAAAEFLQAKGISCEVIDVRTVKPLDIETIAASVTKTGNIAIADISWEFCGFSAEVCAQVCRRVFDKLKRPPLRICPPEWYVGVSEELEKKYYLSKERISEDILKWYC